MISKILSRKSFILANLGVLMLLAAAPVGVLANAANPCGSSATANICPSNNPAPTGTEVVNTNGTVTVTVSGQYSWLSQEINSGSGPGPGPGSGLGNQDDGCGGHYGVGWAMIWNDPNDPGYTLAAGPGGGSSSYLVGSTGNALNPKDDAVHYNANDPCGTPTTVPNPNNGGGDITIPVGEWGPYTADCVEPGGGGSSTSYPECPPTTGYSSSTGATLALTPMQHTYESLADVPPAICVDIYDLHQPFTPGNNNYIANQNPDNSIQTNNFNPAIGAGSCFVPTPPVTAPTECVPTKTVSPQGPVDSGTTLTYTVSVKNTSTTAGPCIVSDVLSVIDGASFSSLSSPFDVTAGTFSFPSSGSLVWTISDLGAGATASFEMTAVASSTGESGAALDNTATVTEGCDASSGSPCSVTVKTPINPPGALSLSVTKTNDAAGQGVYLQNETAPTAGAAVPFKVAITNTSQVNETITSIKDTYGSTTISVCDGTTGTNLIGTVLSPTVSTTCYFTLPNYSPPAGTYLLDTVSVGVEETTDSANTAVAQATSVVQTAPLTPTISVSVDKTNDAAGTGFGKSEEAAAAGAAVPFQVTITNSSQVSETITSITDSYGTTNINVCAGNVNASLAPGASVTCDFTLPNYAPPAGQSLTDTVTASVQQTGNASNTAIGQSSSTVSTGIAPPAPLTVQVTKTNDAAGQGVYLQTETAPQPGAAVPFRVEILNTSGVTEQISSITDYYGATTLAECQSLVGTTLGAGQSIQCDFTISDYSPAAGQSLTDTVVVGVTQPGQPGNTGSGQGSSTVLTAAPPAPALVVTKTVSETQATLGDTLTYTVTVTNDGAGQATDVVINDMMSGTAGFTVNDGTGSTLDSFAGNPVVTVTKIARGDYQWTYATLAPDGGTATVTYTATITAPGSASAIVNGKVTLTNTAVATSPAGGCTTTSCTAVVSTSAPVPAGAVLGASTTTTPVTPVTGAHLNLFLTGILLLAGLVLIGAAVAMRPKEKSSTRP